MAPVLLERDHVLAELNSLARAASRGDGQIVLLRGEAGVGRSALLGRFLAVAPGDTEVLLGVCDPLSAPRPLGPLIDMFSRLPATRAQELEAAIDAGNAESVYRRILDVLRDGHRWVCVIDDAQWADGATLDLLRFLARRIETLPVLVVVSYRDYELGHGHPLAVMLGDMANNASVTRISLAPLSIDAVSVMAAAAQVDADYLYVLTGGNPFYINEILRANPSGAMTASLPRSVAESAWGRLARLSATGREAAEVAAVCGPDVDPRLVEELRPGATAGLNECVRAGLLVATGEVVRFRHELVRLATLEQIPDYVRRGMHQSASSAGAERLEVTQPSMARQSRRHVITPPQIEPPRHRDENHSLSTNLTRREHEILELLAVGHSDAEIAGRLFISQRTVNNHVHAILHKLGAQNRTQAAAYLHQRPNDTGPEAAEC